MKRLLTYMAIIAMAASCSELYGPEPASLAPDTAAGVEITISDVKDSSFTVTVKPSGEASYYSYLVDQSDAPSELDPEALYGVDYTSVAQGTVKWTAEAPSYTFTVDAVQNTTYQVYAVVGSLQGNVGEIAVKSVTTGDSWKPNFVDYETADTTVALAFDEDVYAKGDVTVRYFKRWTAENEIMNDIEAGSIKVAASEIISEDGLAMFSVEGIPAGAYYTVSWGEGAFEDASGNKIEAMESGFYTTEKGTLAPYGLYGRAPFVSFDVTPIEAESFAEYTDPFVTGFDTENAVMKGGAVEDAVATAVYVLGSKTVSLELEYGKDYAFYQGYCLVYLPEEPDRGAVATVTIPAGTFVDEWGNSSNEFTHSAVYSYGYSLDDIAGSYVCDVTSYWYGPYQVTMKIEALETEHGNVAVTEFMGVKCDTPIVADFDMDGGTLTVDDWQKFADAVPDYTYDKDGNPVVDDEGNYVMTSFAAYFCTNSSDGSPVVLNMPEAGVLSTPSLWFGIYGYWADGSDGYYDMFVDFSAVKQPAEDVPAASALAVKGAPKTL